MSKSGFVAIIGRPNSGKSTLLNAILGMELSIVTPKAQTTREKVLGILTEKEDQIVFLDTPGIHRAKEGGLNHYMVNEAKEALEAPHLIWYLVDPSSAIQHEIPVLDILEKAKSDAPVCLLINKVDLLGSKKMNEQALESFISQIHSEMDSRQIKRIDTLKISGLNKNGVRELLDQTWAQIPEGPLYYPDTEQVSDRPLRFFVAEKIRERLYYLLGEEVPYSCAVEIEKFDENAKPLRIEANIYVERDSQKGIVIGNGGKKIKEIGQTAREAIEEFLGQKIFLGLKVKVLRDWTQHSESLKRMGYNLPEQKKHLAKASSKKRNEFV